MADVERVVNLRTQAVLLLILFILLPGSACSEIYRYIDSQGRITYTSDPNSLPDGHELKVNPAAKDEHLKKSDLQSNSSLTVRIEHLNQQLELVKIEFDSNFEQLSDVPADEYVQAAQDILNLKYEMVDLNEELVDLTESNREAKEIRLQRLYAWSEKIDLLLEKDRQENGPQARSSRLEVIGLSVKEIRRNGSSITYSIMADIDNPGKAGKASVKVAGKGVDGHIVTSMTLSGGIGRDESKTLYATAIVEPGDALHIVTWEIVETAIH